MGRTGIVRDKDRNSAELRTCFAYLSFSLFGVKNKSNSSLPNHGAKEGLPDDAE